MAPRSPLLNVMMKAAREAAKPLVRDFGELENLQVSKKGPADFVSAADTRTEKILHRELSKARPKVGFLMEESGTVEGDEGEGRWIIDPVDGTTNLLHGLPHFAISIAFAKADDLIAGLIYDPIKDEMFTAEKGQGAHLNGRRLRVSSRPDIENALFATGIPFKGKPHHELFLDQMKEVMAVSSGIRRYGSAALDLAYVAAGRYDGFWEIGLKIWDIAAGIVLVREAGGFVTDFENRQKMLESGHVVAATPAIHERLLMLLKKAGRV